MKQEESNIKENKRNWDMVLKKRDLFQYWKFRDLKGKQENVQKIRQELKQIPLVKQLKIWQNREDAKQVRSQSLMIEQFAQHNQQQILELRVDNVQKQLEIDRQVSERREYQKQINLIKCKQNYEKRIEIADQTLKEKMKKNQRLLKKQDMLQGRVNKIYNKQLETQQQLESTVKNLEELRNKHLQSCTNSRDNSKENKNRLYYGYTSEIYKKAESNDFLNLKYDKNQEQTISVSPNKKRRNQVRNIEIKRNIKFEQNDSRDSPNFLPETEDPQQN